MKNMTTSIMSTLLLASLLAFLAISAQARTLSDWQNKISMITDNGRLSRSPPPPPKLPPSPHQLTTGYRKTLPSPPPPPIPSSSPDQLTETGAPCAAGSPCNGVIITMITDYGKTPTPRAPPTPKPSPSEHQARVEQLLNKTSSRITDYGKKPTPRAPPTPKPSPSEHQASVKQLLHKTPSPNYHSASS